jgi:hypothetical protein
MDVLPLLRRTFGGFAPAERANIAGAVKQLDGGGPGPARTDEPVDAARAAAVLATVAGILTAGRGDRD